MKKPKKKDLIIAAACAASAAAGYGGNELQNRTEADALIKANRLMAAEFTEDKYAARRAEEVARVTRVLREQQQGARASEDFLMLLTDNLVRGDWTVERAADMAGQFLNMPSGRHRQRLVEALCEPTEKE